VREAGGVGPAQRAMHGRTADGVALQERIEKSCVDVLGNLCLGAGASALSGETWTRRDPGFGGREMSAGDLMLGRNRRSTSIGRRLAVDDCGIAIPDKGCTANSRSGKHTSTSV